jgi:hypothetical protein
VQKTFEIVISFCLKKFVVEIFLEKIIQVFQNYMYFSYLSKILMDNIGFIGYLIKFHLIFVVKNFGLELSFQRIPEKLLIQNISLKLK